MGPCPTADVLVRLLAEQLSNDEYVVVADHVENCEACRETLSRLDTDDPAYPIRCPNVSSQPPTTCPSFLDDLARDPPSVSHEELVPAVPGFEILDKLGGGGMGVVYRARDVTLDWIVAIKMPRQGALEEPQARKRFEREARVLAQLRHPHIVPVHRADLVFGHPYFVMDYVAGGNLATHKARFAGDTAAAATLVAKVARGVDHAHRQGIIHRDIKLSNIFLDERGDPLVGDFGVAGLLDDGSRPTPLDPSRDTPVAQDTTDDSRLTRTGAAVGTPVYMAPEQFVAGPVGHAADIWALGTVLFELLTGHAPFRAETREEVMRQVLKEEPPPLRRLNPRVDAELEAIFLKCLEKQPARRYATASDLADDLGRWLQRKPTVARPRSRPARFIRGIRRHWLATAAAIFVVLATVATPFIIDAFDPDRELKKVVAQLKQGLAVELIGETGPPKWYRWATDKSQSRVPKSTDGTFSINSAKLGLLELVPDPQWENYTFSVEIREDWIATGTGEVGIYFLHAGEAEEHMRVHCYGTISYHELEWRGRKTFLSLEINRYAEPHADIDLLRETFAKDTTIPRSDPTEADRWRKLTVNVTPMDVRASWARTKKAGTWDAEEFGILTYDLSPVYHAGKMRRAFPHLQPSCGPRGALGLYVFQATASFRHAVLEPRVDANR